MAGERTLAAVARTAVASARLEGVRLPHLSEGATEMKGFRDFVLRGNLVELAVAFIMATAFGAVVTATVALLMDVMGKVGGTPDFSNYSPGGVSVGAWLTAIITFAILAAVVYFFIVLPYQAARERMARGGEEPPAAVPEEVALLTEIRDLLASRNT
jgi:large conductance mechanosensitive channel